MDVAPQRLVTRRNSEISAIMKISNKILFCKAANKGYSSRKGKFRSDKLSTTAVVSQN
ncbi:hypothetical protein T11_8753 [Trichinella zimbabwensis]|uniref:Uncharacterized protein n=1 Tax=Trichinella zimbabwensis TaxID=268475 RepID=A0A0V1GBY8_9BILA|nr:hypothetical protein T11_8753 [Trichinella zimbabwensis]